MEQYPGSKILFVGAKGRMEMTKVVDAGYEIIGLNISGFQRRLTLENLLFPLKVISSFLSSIRILKNFNPQVVVGFGGYASSPITLAAARKQVPIVLQEQNSYAGLANKAVAKRASKICVAYHNMGQFFPSDKIELTGNPIRKNIKLGIKKEDGLAHFDLDEAKKTILVVGGSLGARTLNESIIQNIERLLLSNYQIIWQTGSFYYTEMLERVKNFDLKNIRLVEFINEMDKAYASADIVVSRAGALTISELSVIGKAVVFVPSPNVAEDHQTKNAMALVDTNAAEIIADKNAINELIDKAFELLENDIRIAELEKNILKLGKPKATESILNQVLSLVK
jgi:UDP-N-acetylglucosamine--N-acetylmuramyl-(pentapeptide) pyrophosphoryl-undecaprenol N-acetylglucosamine transferase